MNMNIIGGTLVVAALAGILTLHGCDRKVPAPKPVATQVSKPAVVPVAKPVVTPDATKATAKVVYHRVVPGGQTDGTITCKFVRSFVAGKTQAQLDALRKQYKVSGDELASYKACLN